MFAVFNLVKRLVLVTQLLRNTKRKTQKKMFTTKCFVEYSPSSRFSSHLISPSSIPSPPTFILLPCSLCTILSSGRPVMARSGPHTHTHTHRHRMHRLNHNLNASQFNHCCNTHMHTLLSDTHMQFIVLRAVMGRGGRHQ